MKRLVIIPARGGSKRIPNKNIKLFNGEPIIGKTIRTVLESKLFNSIHVSTDSEEIQKISLTFGASVPFLRESSLADDYSTLDQVVRWVLSKLKSSFDTVLVITPTSPLISSKIITQAVDQFESSDQVVPLLSVTRFPCPIEWAMHEENSYVVPLNPLSLNTRSQDLKNTFYDTGNFYIFNPKYIENMGHQKNSKYLKFEIPAYRAVDIDNLDDFKKAEMYSQLIEKMNLE